VCVIVRERYAGAGWAHQCPSPLPSRRGEAARGCLVLSGCLYPRSGVWIVSGKKSETRHLVSYDLYEAGADLGAVDSRSAFNIDALVGANEQSVVTSTSIYGFHDGSHRSYTVCASSKSETRHLVCYIRSGEDWALWMVSFVTG
jgi:hypothetical protein